MESVGEGHLPAQPESQTDRLLKLDHSNVFFSDTWAIDRLTLTLGLRYDHYKSHVPDQTQLANTFGGISVAARQFPAQTFFTWNSMVPRAGLTYDLTGDGRTVVKANYGYFRHNPGPGIAASGNPNQAGKTITYNWTDANGNRLFDAGEQVGAAVQDLTGPGGVSIDPDIKQPYTHELSTFFERQLTDVVGVRAGYLYKSWCTRCKGCKGCKWCTRCTRCKDAQWLRICTSCTPCTSCTAGTPPV